MGQDVVWHDGHFDAEIRGQPHRVLPLERGLEHCADIVRPDVGACLERGVQQIGRIHAARETERHPWIFLEKFLQRHICRSPFLY